MNQDAKEQRLLTLPEGNNVALLPDGKLPTMTISILSTLMSEGDLRLLQWSGQDSQESLGPELVETAYEAARDRHPEAPSLKGLMAWDRQDPFQGQQPPSE